MGNISITNMKRIIEYVRKSDVQLILPILNDRIKDCDIKNEEVILKLSEQDKLFKV